MRTSLRLLAAGLFACLPVAEALAVDISEGARLADTCTGCHGLEGRSLGAVPSIAGRPAEELAELLRAYKAQELDATIMNRLARGYSDEEIAILADYFSSKSPK
jgi:sulfide dehydrogenase cytochrome subunit